MEKKSLKENQSVARVLQIIEVMAENKAPMRLLDIARALDLPASTTLRFLSTLMTHNYVKQDGNSLKYSLTVKLCRLGDMVQSQISIRDTVHPYLVELSQKCGESACLAIEENEMAVYIDVVEGPDNMLKAMQRIGKIAPLHCTGVGKLMLLNYDNDKIKEIMERRGMPAFTKNTITTPEKLYEELDRVRANGFAVDNEECEIGAKCIAAPLRDYRNRIIACISISGPVSRMKAGRHSEIARQVVHFARKISEEFGYTP